MSGSLRTGSSLGPYRIVAPLAAGGMGEVFRAHDSKLNRPVALKILPAEAVGDEDRLRRFVQEARSASALSHPSIVTIYDVGEAVPVDESGRPPLEATSLHYIAMELIDGVTLRQLLADRAIEPRTLLAHLAQAADGVAKAHGAGIVHRDLKPENIMVTRDGFAKVLDFGLAKLTEPDAPGGALAAAPTALPDQATRSGAVMGTVGYMSPEQAMGRPVDHRTDVFAFGCLLYEAATGRRPFLGESAVDVLHAIVREKPTPVEEIAPRTPVALVRTIRRCLAKDPDRRYQSMKDLALELHEMVEEWENLATPTGPVSSGAALSGDVGTRRHGFGRVAWTGIALGGCVLFAVAFLLLRSTFHSGRGVGAFRTMRLTGATSSGQVETAALGPQARYLAYTRRGPNGWSLWLRQLATGRDVQLVPPQGDRLVRNPTFTPDGSYVDYTRSDEVHNLFTLYRIPVLGGTPRKILVDIDTPVTYSPDGRRFAFVRNVFPESQNIVIADADGGNEKTVMTRNPQGGRGFLYERAGEGPAWSPDGRSLAAQGWTKAGGFRIEVVIVDLAKRSERPLGDTTWLDLEGVAWTRDGGALVVSGIPKGQTLAPQLWRVAYPDGAITRITNDSSIYTGVSISSDGASLASVQLQRSATLWRRSLRPPGRDRQLTFSSRQMIGGLAAAADGTIFYHYRFEDRSGVARLDPAGGEPLPITRPDTPSNDPAVTRDGRTVLCRSFLPGGRIVLRIMDADGRRIRELPERGATFPFALDPDGRFVAVRDERGLWREPLDGGPATLLVESETVVPLGYSPSGDRLAYLAARVDPGRPPQPTIEVAPAAGGGPVARLERPPGTIDDFRWAPDGQALTFRRKEGDGYNVWRLPLDGGPSTRITDFDSVVLGDYVLSADGSTLTFTKVRSTSDAVLIEGF
jgi:serine/threonine protein kinase/Tol biopolymer transport system component